MNLQVVLLSIAAVAVLVGGPIVLIWSVVDYVRGRGSERRGGGGGVSAAVGASLQEIDRLLTRPSIEHQIETEHKVVRREDNADGE